jgi:chromate transporter
VRILEAFFHASSFAWGGEPVALQLLLGEAAPRLASGAQLLLAFALVQAAPGPMLNFSAFLGARCAGLAGAALAWVGAFLPGLLLVHAALPFWAALRASTRAQAVLKGVDAAASGLLVAAAITLLGCIDSPPQKAICVLVFAVDHFVSPTRLGQKLGPPAAIAFGAILGLPLCMPWAAAALPPTSSSK